MAEGVGNAPTSAMPILFSRQVQPAYICLPFIKCQGGGIRTRGLSELRVLSAECRMPERMIHLNLQMRTKPFALQVIKFCEGLPKDETSRTLGRQLLRSGTAVGANYRAACRAKSKPAFISKMGDGLEEADEPGYWVELLSESGKVDEKSAAPVLREANELAAIPISSINAAKRNSGAEQ